MGTGDLNPPPQTKQLPQTLTIGFNGLTYATAMNDQAQPAGLHLSSDAWWIKVKTK
jgi:hypothetical protein